MYKSSIYMSPNIYIDILFSINIYIYISVVPYIIHVCMSSVSPLYVTLSAFKIIHTLCIYIYPQYIFFHYYQYRVPHMIYLCMGFGNAPWLHLTLYVILCSPWWCKYPSSTCSGRNLLAVRVFYFLWMQLWLISLFTSCSRSYVFKVREGSYILSP